MPDETPQPPPAAVIVRLAREAAGLTIPGAARAAGISTARWSQVEAGRETRRGRVRPVTAKDGTLARMARAVGIPPERLEAEGQRPDAADILREMQRGEETPRTVPPAAPPVPAGTPPPSAMARALFPGDPAKQRLYDLPDMDDTEKAALFEALDEARARRDGKPGIRDSA